VNDPEPLGYRAASAKVTFQTLKTDPPSHESNVLKAVQGLKLFVFAQRHVRADVRETVQER
jgi:hypothetical protein